MKGSAYLIVFLAHIPWQTLKETLTCKIPSSSLHEENLTKKMIHDCHRVVNLENINFA